MIAPDPAPAGPRPANPRPDAARGAEPQSRSPRGERAGGDFDSVLAGPVARRHSRASDTSGAEAAPTTEAPAAPAQGEVPAAFLVPVPVAAAAEPEMAAVGSEVQTVAAVTAPDPASPPVEVSAEVPDSAVPAAPGPAAPVAAEAKGFGDGPPPQAAPPVPESVTPATPASPAPQAAPAAKSALPSVQPDGSKHDSAGIGRKADPEPPEADAPVVRHVASAPAAGSGSSSPAPSSAAPPAVAGDAPRMVLHDAGPASWHLTVEPGTSGARNEAAPVQSQAAAIQPQAVVAQVAVAIGRASDRRVEIRLDPPELGRVQIHLTPLDGGGVQAMVLADRPETQDLLRRHAEVLARELGSAGYDSVSLDFAAGNDTAPGRDEPRAAERVERLAIAGAIEAVPAAAPRRSLTGGLDVRL